MHEVTEEKEKCRKNDSLTGCCGASRLPVFAASYLFRLFRLFTSTLLAVEIICVAD